MQIELNYGRTRLPVRFSPDWNVTVLRKTRMPVLQDPQAAIRNALASPVASQTLNDLATSCRSACILICDITRPVPNGLFLPVLVKQLINAGMPAGNIKILVATGLHRPNEGEELAELVGDSWVLDNVSVLNHFARNPADLIDLGTTSTRGTRVWLNRHFVEADLKIVTGLVEPHFMAGYSGGRKVIAPGIAGQETITTFHNAHFMGNPNAANCILDGNPLHEEQLQIVNMLGGALALNTVIDEERQLSFVNFGEIVESHLQAVEFIRSYAEVPVPQRFKTVVTSAAGYPLDKTYYQTVKGMVGPLDILEPGGNLIIASACDEGMGSPEYVEAQMRLLELGQTGFMSAIRAKTHAAIDEWQTQMQLKPMAVGNIHLYSEGLSENDRALTGVNMITSVSEAVRASIEQSGDNRVAVVPEGPYIVPVYKPAATAAH
jgi:nickel-dependent lactate racemase